MSTYATGFAAALRASRPGSPLSNGTEWDMFAARYCDHCIHDTRPDEVGCPLIAVALLHRTPALWRPEPGHIAPRFRCDSYATKEDT